VPNAALTLNRIDESLANAQAAVARLGAALFELDTERERRSVELPVLIGGTETAWKQTGSQLSVLWAWYRALAGVVEGISDRRKGPPLHPAELAEIWALLSTASVEVPADSQELARDCLPESETVPDKAPIALMVQVISAAYRRIAETITSIVTVLKVALPRLDELLRALSETNDQARSAGLRLPNEALALRRQLDELREQASSDPLSVDIDRIPILAQAIERVQAQLAEATQVLLRVDEAFAVLASSLDAAEAAVCDAEKAVQTVAVKIVLSTDALDEVRALQRTANQVRVELEHARRNIATDRRSAVRAAGAIESTVASLRTDAERLSTTAAQQLTLRQELRGRLDAYRAKAYALGQDEDVNLDRLYRSAREVLYTAPCDLARAERRLAAYQTAVLASPLEDRLS
jgi:hypothetical protein